MKIVTVSFRVSVTDGDDRNMKIFKNQQVNLAQSGPQVVFIYSAVQLSVL